MSRVKGGNHSPLVSQRGNQTAVDVWNGGGWTNRTQGTFDKANKLTGRKSLGNAIKPSPGDSFTNGSTAANWTKIGSGDAFGINSPNAGKLTLGTVAQDTISLVGSAGTPADPLSTRSNRSGTYTAHAEPFEEKVAGTFSSFLSKVSRLVRRVRFSK